MGRRNSNMNWRDEMAIWQWLYEMAEKVEKEQNGRGSKQSSRQKSKMNKYKVGMNQRVKESWTTKWPTIY